MLRGWFIPWGILVYMFFKLLGILLVSPFVVSAPVPENVIVPLFYLHWSIFTLLMCFIYFLIETHASSDPVLFILFVQCTIDSILRLALGALSDSINPEKLKSFCNSMWDNQDFDKYLSIPKYFSKNCVNNYFKKDSMYQDFYSGVVCVWAIYIFSLSHLAC